MAIIGVDPGTEVTGYGIIREDGHKSHRIISGVIRMSADSPRSGLIPEIHNRLDGVIRVCRPDVMVVESLFHSVPAFVFSRTLSVSFHTAPIVPSE
jgi:crossover junction endodeoxyribonuclease RuvC